MDAFNYISFGSREYVESLDNTFAMPRGRMFEYTPVDIEKRLDSLNSDSISYLESLPTFLCSEIVRGDGDPLMIVKFGHVKNIAVGLRELTATFETVIDLGAVSFPSVEAAQTAFGADGFQLYRTHWAVREGDAAGVLARLAADNPEVAQALAGEGQAYPEGQKGEPPARTKNILGTADSVEAFLKLLYEAPAKEFTETFFRGHESDSYELTPSLLRKKPDGSWQFMPSEYRLCKELLIAHHDEFQNDQYCFDRLVRMQHYGLPTRLLDISGNPLVALFFACGAPGTTESHGEVIVFNVLSEKIKYYDSDTVSCISNLCNMTFDQKSEIDVRLELTEFNRTAPAIKLLHHIKSEKGYFEDRIVPDDLGSIVCVKAKRTNTRIKSQSGAFLLFGHEATLPESGQEGIEVARVAIENKEHILQQLDRININATTVYPSIDQTAVHLRDMYKL